MIKALLACLIFFISDFLGATSAEEVLASRRPLTIGIISAVPGEVGAFHELLTERVTTERGGRKYYKGKLYDIDTVLVASRIGKVAAAATATHLILEYKVDLVIFTGVAGAIDPSLNIGDVVVANGLIQHDMDARPFCSIYEIPLLKITSCDPDPFLSLLATRASKKFIEQDFRTSVPLDVVTQFSIFAPKVMNGLILTGDKVISQEDQKKQLKERLPEALCVEMEGASVGQVCYEYGIPFAVIRTVSDYAQHQNTVVDVRKFVATASSYYSFGILKNLYGFIRSTRPPMKSS